MVDFVWGAKGEIEVLRVASCHISFQASHGNTLSSYDARQSINQAVAEKPLFFQYNQNTSTVHVGYGNEASVDALSKALDQRLVTLGQSSKVTIRVRRDTAEGVVAAVSREWEDDILEEGEVDMRSIQEDFFQRATPGHRPDTIVLRQLPCKWFGIASEEAGASEKLRTHIEQALVTIPTKVDAVFLPCGLLMDVYIQFGRLVEVEKAFARFQGKALRYESSKVVKPVVVQLDRSGFFTDAQCRAREAVKEREAQARQFLEGKRICLGKERKEIAALLKALDRGEHEEEEGGEEKEDGRGKASIRRELLNLNKSLAEADSIDQRLVKEPGRVTAQAMIKEIGELQHYCRRGIAATEAELARLRDEAHEKQRLDGVREVRVAQAKALKESDRRWRVGLEGLALLKEARQSKLCASFIKGTESALAEARDLVLREAHKIINLEEYFQRLQGSLKEAEKKVSSTLRLLRMDGEAREVEESFKALCTSMKEAGEDALPRRRESEEGLVDVVVEIDSGLDEILPRFLHHASRATTYRKALAAALLLNERRRSEGVQQKDEQEQVEEFALVCRELQGHVRSLLPAWDLYSKLRLWQVRLKRLWQQSVHWPRGERRTEKKQKKRKGEEDGEREKGKQGLVPAIVNAFGAAKLAFQAAVALLEKVADECVDDKDDEEKENAVEMALFVLQQAVGDAEVTISKLKEKERMRREVRRRLEEEKALAERNRDEEMQVKAREEILGRYQLERLERRKVHLEASLKREEARDRLKEIRAAGFLPFPEAEAEMKGKEDEGISLSVMGVEGSKAVVIAPAPIEESERWSMVPMQAGPPLNLTLADSLPNLVSADYWMRERQREADGVENARAGYLRSEVVAIGADGEIVSAAATAAAGKRRQSDHSKVQSTRASIHKSRRKRGSTGSMGEDSSSNKTRSVVMMGST